MTVRRSIWAIALFGLFQVSSATFGDLGGMLGGLFGGGGGGNCPTVALEDDCWKYCHKAIQQATFCTGMHLCECQALEQENVQADAVNCNACYHANRDPNNSLQVNLAGANMFMESDDFFNHIVENTFGGWLTGCGQDNGPPGNQCPPPPPPPPPPPETEEPEPTTEAPPPPQTSVAPPPPPKTVVVTKPGGKHTQVVTVTHAHTTQYVVTEGHTVKHTAPCTTITGHVTLTRTITKPGQTIAAHEITVTSTVKPAENGQPPVLVTVTKTLPMQVIGPTTEVVVDTSAFVTTSTMTEALETGIMGYVKRGILRGD